MATKSANLYARIEPEVKEQAESILSTLGIPASNAINMFYKQIILNRGLPFEVKIPTAKSVNGSFFCIDRQPQDCIVNGNPALCNLRTGQLFCTFFPVTAHPAMGLLFHRHSYERGGGLYL